MNKKEALTKFLNEDLENLHEREAITEFGLNGVRFECGNQEYLVLTDEEADLYVKEYIDQSLWAFNASFLVSYIEGVCDLDAEAYEAFIKIIQTTQEKMCEGCNDILFALVKNNFDDLVSDAISADGRGHFLSTYDGQEHEVGDYFIYRTN